MAMSRKLDPLRAALLAPFLVACGASASQPTGSDSGVAEDAAPAGLPDAGAGGASDGEAGRPWIAQSSGVLGTLHDVTFGADRFVAVGADTIVTSPEGVTWTSRALPSTANLQSVAYGQGVFVAVGYQGVALSSSDGATWKKQQPPVTGSTEMLASVAYGNGRFVAVGTTLRYWTSTDGATWKEHTVNGSGGVALANVAFHAGTFLAVNGNRWALSTDGLAWTWGVDGEMTAARRAANGASMWVSVSAKGAIYTSPFGNAWTRAVPRSAADANTSPDALYDVAFGSSGFTAVGVTSAGTPLVFSSGDGRSWQRQLVTGACRSGVLEGVSSGAGTIVAVGTSGCIMTTPE